MKNYEWTDRGLCTVGDPDLWFSSDEDDIATAKTICGWCPVLEQCAQRAAEVEGTLSRSYRFGVWAGKDTRERAVGATQHNASYKAAALRARILTMPDLEADVVASIAGCSAYHVWRVRRLHAAQQQDMGKAA
ncbi:WhiB family transcriptional regulator [Streptomyces sp. NPDC048272]|uniref:WhiB family transcriptional regulator n=1 Tax=Streptomyces sp. NPDC048272 TaxID=3154616 RepID=UPI003436B67E